MHHPIYAVHHFHDYLLTIPYLGDIKPVVLYMIVFLSSFVESIPIIGTFAPGTVLLLLFGFIATHPRISILAVIACAALGGVLGDFVGYYLGKHSFKYITKIKWVMKYAKLESGQAFFNRHGGKSVLFARFIGPIRPIVPLLAGATGMPIKKFLLWNISGSILWATTYITIGYFFGANFRYFAFWASRASLLAFVVIVIIVGLYGWKEKKTQEVLDELKAEGDTKLHSEKE